MESAKNRKQGLIKRNYYDLDYLLNKIDEPNRSKCLEIIKSNQEIIHESLGSRHNHQNWRGGYLDHLREIMNIALVLYKTMNKYRQLEFSISDVLLILFLHDLEKPWIYCKKENLPIKKQRLDFVKQKVKEYKFELTKEHENAILFVEGENKDYSPNHRVMGRLAAFCHICDTISARIWFDHPFEKNDSWGFREF